MEQGMRSDASSTSGQKSIFVKCWTPLTKDVTETCELVLVVYCKRQETPTAVFQGAGTAWQK